MFKEYDRLAFKIFRPSGCYLHKLCYDKKAIFPALIFI